MVLQTIHSPQKVNAATIEAGPRLDGHQSMTAVGVLHATTHAKGLSLTTTCEWCGTTQPPFAFREAGTHALNEQECEIVRPQSPQDLTDGCWGGQ